MPVADSAHTLMRNPNHLIPTPPPQPQELVACLLSCASEDEMRRLLLQHVRAGVRVCGAAFVVVVVVVVVVGGGGAAVSRLVQAGLVEAASRIKAHAQAAGVCR